MSRSVAFAVAFLVALPVGARELVFPTTLPDPVEETAAAKPRELNWRANQINRCPNGRGGVTLQDAPCTPSPAAAASVAAQPVEVVELASLPPRPPATVATPVPAANGTDYTKGLLNGAWKLGLLGLGLYLAYRAVLVVRDQVRRRRVPDVIPNHGPMPR